MKFELETRWKLPTGVQVKVINKVNLRNCQPYITFQLLDNPKKFIVRTPSECLDFKPLP